MDETNLLDIDLDLALNQMRPSGRTRSKLKRSRGATAPLEEITHQPFVPETMSDYDDDYNVAMIKGDGEDDGEKQPSKKKKRAVGKSKGKSKVKGRSEWDESDEENDPMGIDGPFEGVGLAATKTREKKSKKAKV